MNDSKYNYLRSLGFSGALNEITAAFWRSLGAVGGALQDLEDDLLCHMGLLEGSLQDRWQGYFGKVGYTGDAEAAWSAGAISYDNLLREQAIDSIRRNGGTLIMPAANVLGDGQPNLLSAPEFAGGLTDAPNRAGLVTASTLAGYDGALAFGHDGSTLSYALKPGAHSVGLTYTLSVIVEMTDGLAPSFGSSNSSASSNSFVLVPFNSPVNPLTYVVESLGGSLYRVSGSATCASVFALGHGVYKYSTNSPRNFKVTGYKLEQNATATAYTPQSVLRTRGSFTDSTGVNPATTVSDVLGLVLDRSYGGAVGSAIPTYKHGTWTDNGNGTYTKALAGWGALGGYQAGKVGKTFRITFKVDALTAGTTIGVYRRNAGNTDNDLVATINVSAGGTYTAVGQIVFDFSPHTFWLDSATFTGTISNLVVVEVLGSHATQATTGSKPTLVRVPKRLGVNLALSTGTTTGWGLNNVNIATDGTSLTATSTSTSNPNAFQSGLAVTAGKSYLLTVQGKVGTATNAQLMVGNNGAFPTLASTTSTSFATLSGVIVAGASTIQPILLMTASAIGQTASFQQLLVQEVLEWSWAMSFDPSAPGDFLQTNITTGNEGWVCSGVTFGGAAANNETVFASGAGSATQKGVWLLRNSTSSALRMGVGNGTALAMTTVSSLPLLGIPRVVEGGWDASTVTAGVDGVTSSTARTGDGTAPGTALIGAFLGGILQLNGPMTAAVICPVLPSAADRALIRRFIGSLQGQML